MKHISILVPKGHVIVDTIIGSLNLFQMANGYHHKHGLSENGIFKLDLVGSAMEPQVYGNYLSISPTKTFETTPKTDLIIVPGLVGNMEQQVAINQESVEWIRNQRIQHQTEIVSLCRGAFLVAQTGLMNGKSCATHWLTHDQFRRMFPAITLLPDKIVNEDNGIYSSGGAYSFLNLLLYLIEKFYGRETAIWCSKVSEIEFDRMNQNQFVIFNGQKDHSDEGVKEVQAYIEKHFAEKISVELLAQRIATSSRNFVRRFKKATNNTPIEYIQRIRVEAAKKQLESSTLNIYQIMYGVGYNDDKTFRTLFKRYVGTTPLEYRNKYNPEMALI